MRLGRVVAGQPTMGRRSEVRRTAAFTLGANAGAMLAVSHNVDVFAQLGLRYMSGISKVDAFVGTGLESINDKSARWATPFSAGVRFRF